MKHLSILLLLAMILSCQPDNKSIQGHWHSIDLGDDARYLTLDIQDSTAILNKSDRIGYYSESKLRFESNRVFADFGFYYYNVYFEFNGDTLLMIENDNLESELKLVTKFIRIKDNQISCIKDFNSNSHLKIVLPIDNNSTPFDSLVEGANWSIVNIGYARTKRFRKYGSDTLLLKINDAIGNFSDLREFLISECESINTTGKGDTFGKIDFIINAHRDTPKSYFDSIDYYILNNFEIDNIYRTSANNYKMTVGLMKLQ